MSAEISGIIFFFIFESLLFLSSVRIQYRFLSKFRNPINDGELIIIWISINIVLSIAVASVLSFAQFNGPSQYLLFSILIFSITHLAKKQDLTEYFKLICEKLAGISRKILNWKILLMFSLILPLVVFRMSHPNGFDEAYMLNFMLDWAFNEANPYFRAWYYPPTWELAYLPSIVITNSDNFFWFVAFKPLIIVTLGAYLIGRQIGIPKNLSIMATYTGILLFLFWAGGLDPSQMKNFQIVAAGTILLVYSILRTIQLDFNRLTAMFYIFGLTFTLIKYTGVAIMLISLFLLLLFNGKKILQIRNKVIIWGLFGFLIISSISGHYYLSNYIEFGNPFYLVKLNVLGFELPGLADWSGSSIVSNLDDERVWNSLFPTTRISQGGLFFPATLIFGLVGSLGIICYSIINYTRKGKIDSKILFLSIFVLLTWILYYNTALGAGHLPGQVHFIENLKSMKYAEGTIILTELLFVYFLYRIKIPEKIILGVVGVNLVSRFFIIYQVLPPRIFLHSPMDNPIIISIIIVIIATIILSITFSRIHQIPRLFLIFSLGLVIFILSPTIGDHIVAENKNWAHGWRNITMELYNLPTSDVYLITTNYKDGFQYFVYGKNFQHLVTTGTEKDLFMNLNCVDKISEECEVPQYIVKMCRRNIDCNSEMDNLVSLLNSYNYKIKNRDTHAILLKLD